MKNLCGKKAIATRHPMVMKAKHQISVFVAPAFKAFIKSIYRKEIIPPNG